MSSDQRVRAREDREYQPFPERPDRNTRQQSLEVPLLVRCLGIRGAGRILEVGCGAGIALPALHRICAPDLIVGVDVNPVALQYAAERTAGLSPGIELVRADVRSLPMPDESFDAVIDFGTCYHIARSSDALAEITRVLRPGGIFATETRLSQLISHPFRSFGRTLPMRAVPGLRLRRHCGLWFSFSKRHA